MSQITEQQNDETLSNISDISSLEDFVEDDDVNMVSQPNIQKNLYPHQLSAIYMMEERERAQLIELSTNTFDNKITTNIGIYSDITGYGKTLSVIGMIKRDRMNWDMSREYDHTYISVSYTHLRAHET